MQYCNHEHFNGKVLQKFTKVYRQWYVMKYFYFIANVPSPNTVLINTRPYANVLHIAHWLTFNKLQKPLSTVVDCRVVETTAKRKIITK